MAVRPLGTMVTYGYPGVGLEDESKLAIQIGASLLEILPEWSQLPDPVFLRQHAADRGLGIHSAHGCWGGRTIRRGKSTWDRLTRQPIANRSTI